MQKSSENGNGNNKNSGDRYRKLVEHEQQMLDSLSERLGSLETSGASTQSDIRSLFNLVENIANQLDRIVDRTRPNMLGMVVALIAAVGLLATIGMLAFTPVYKTLNNIAAKDAHMQELMEGVISSRFTPADGVALRAELHQDIKAVSDLYNERIIRNEEWITELMRVSSKLEGLHDTRYGAKTD